MVSRRLLQGASAVLLIVTILVGDAQARTSDPDPVGTRPRNSDGPVGPVRSALKAGDFPWYDATSDQVRPIKLREARLPEPPTGNFAPFRWGWSDYLVFGGFVVALLVLAVLIYRYWDRFGSGDAAAVELLGRASPTAHDGQILPAALRGVLATDDPWAEANRRRLAGDLAGAIICLFAHQLIILARLGLVRLAPGRTPRQLCRAVSDREFQALVLPTLRQFEAVYYGHKTPTATDFADIWAAAEAFERRVLVQGAG